MVCRTSPVKEAGNVSLSKEFRYMAPSCENTRAKGGGWTDIGRTDHGQDDDPRQVQFLADGMGQGGLARPRATGHSNDTQVGPWWCVMKPFLNNHRLVGGHGRFGYHLRKRLSIPCPGQDVFCSPLNFPLVLLIRPAAKDGCRLSVKQAGPRE